MAPDNSAPPRPNRSSSLDAEAIHKLEVHLSERPEKSELVERNILQAGRAPTLDIHKLEKQLNERPGKNELVERNILKDDKGIAPSLIAAREALERSQLEDKLDHALQSRPKPEELVKEGILQRNLSKIISKIIVPTDIMYTADEVPV
ncbi:hypothetical protein CCMSSC00406_0002557 [Pleurotus cornucopiae]|uniref:Uncharacterized protein n=1 Tax=Pleurotus cornucopiae TaxID=5321 RepID=A0ACB7ITJ2_PLECO|nr:hypothetical protein CCMSSC00406_0002557 [Pleurotus cornucopiae]